MPFVKDHKPVRRRPVSDAVKRLEKVTSGEGNIESRINPT